jgi:hypothetical protein
VNGRRLADVLFGDLPQRELKPGDYWKYLDRETGEAKRSDEPGNLTHTVWGFCSPAGTSDVPIIGTLMKHTVREHEDGTITVAPGDGSSNSIAVGGPNTPHWHGYVEHGVWTAA